MQTAVSNEEKREKLNLRTASYKAKPDVDISYPVMPGSPALGGGGKNKIFLRRKLWKQKVN